VKSLETQIASIPPSERVNRKKLYEILDSLHDMTPAQRREAADGIWQQLRLGATASPSTGVSRDGPRLTIELAPRASVQALKRSLSHLSVGGPSLVDAHTLELRLKPTLNADSALSEIEKDPRVERAYITPQGTLQ
jgi:hypothetical protein